MCYATMAIFIEKIYNHPHPIIMQSLPFHHLDILPRDAHPPCAASTDPHSTDRDMITFDPYSTWWSWMNTYILLTYPSHESHNTLDKYPIMHHFLTEMCTHVHISVTKWCIVRYGTGALWDLWDWPAQVTGIKKVFNHISIEIKSEFIFIVRRAGLLWSQQDFEWLWSVPLSSASLYQSFLLFCLICVYSSQFSILF